MPLPSGALLLAFLTLQRLIELQIARRHTRALLARGAYECGADHYPIMVALHETWLCSLWYFGWNHGVAPLFLGLLVMLQFGRVWVLRTLGERWTTRIIIVPRAAPVRSGPFRFMRHPNYVIVAAELPCVSLALGLQWHALLFGTLNIAMLGWRIRAENAAFAAVSTVRS